MSVTHGIRMKLIAQVHEQSIRSDFYSNPFDNSSVDLAPNVTLGVATPIQLAIPGLVNSDSVPRLEASVVMADRELPTLKGQGLTVEVGTVMVTVVWSLNNASSAYSMESAYNVAEQIARRYAPTGPLQGSFDLPAPNPRIEITGAAQIKEPEREMSRVYIPVIVPYRASWTAS